MPEEVGEDAGGRISSWAAEEMRKAIKEVAGREVFFAGALNREGQVIRVRVCARGHEGAVPALIAGLEKGEVVLHNHASGEVAPSEADVQLASLFSFQGHGVYIIDNAVQRVYVVVEPILERERRPLDPAELAEHISPSSRVAKRLPQYEIRPQQTEMMQTVAQAFNDDGIAVIEAPTGVGKTVAYLVPAIFWAVRNRERVVVSTRTINLQEQIIRKDIPLLAKCLGAKFNTVLVKGRNNYLCWRKLRRALSEATLFEDDANREALAAIAEWAETTEDGSLSDLPFVPPRDLWSEICSEPDTCRIANCPNPKKCFIGRARREIAKADILVTNHHLLFADLAVKRELGTFSTLAVLPAYQRVIFDEAHSIEDSATEYFGEEATRNGALALIGRFIRSERGQERGLLPYIKMRLVREKSAGTRQEIEEILRLIDNELLPNLASARSALQAAFDTLRSLVAERCRDIGRDIKWRLTPERLMDPDLRDIHNVYVLPAADEVETCAGGCTGLLEKLKVLEPRDPKAGESPFLTELMQLEAYRDRLNKLAVNLVEGTCDTLQPNTVRWIEIDAGKKTIVRVLRCPLEVGQALADWVYSNLKTVVMTSATLSVGQRFDYLFQRLGLDRVSDRPIDARVLPTPFDFPNQALLALATDIAEPNESSFLDDCVDYIRQTLAITKGHAFILFTSFYALDYVHSRLAEELKEAGIAPLKQGQAARTQLLDRFRRDAASVLFATDSFWEGVDVAGQALQCVILAKLPFRVPTEPVLEARAEAIEEAGGNSFMEYTVPQAVIKFRQGFGRLIRRKTDRGTVVVLDKRVVTKHYGRVFLESLPGLRTVRGPRPLVLGALRGFYSRQESEDAP